MTKKAVKRDRVVFHIEAGIVLVAVVGGSWVLLALIDLFFKAMGVG